MDKKKIIVAVVVCGLIIYGAYVLLSAENPGKEELRSGLILLLASSQLLNYIFSSKKVWVPPAEIQEDEDYILAKNRIDIGGKISITGGLMIGVPLITLFITGELNGFLAELFVISFFGGILILLIGIVIYTLGCGYIETKAIESQRETIDPSFERTSEESQISKICSTIALLVATAYLATFFI